MALPQDRNLLPLARNLRKNMTKEERLLWYGYLRECPVKFYRQRILGNYIADFYSAKAKLVIELDGSQHYDLDAIAYDQNRSAYLRSIGMEVLRFSNADVLYNFAGVCDAIQARLQSLFPEHPDLPYNRGGAER